MTIHDIVSEIKSLESDSIRKAVFDINRLLTNNKTLLLKHIDKDNLNPLLIQFDNFTQAPHKEYTSDSFAFEYQKNYNLLLYYFNKIG